MRLLCLNYLKKTEEPEEGGFPWIPVAIAVVLVAAVAVILVIRKKK